MAARGSWRLGVAVACCLFSLPILTASSEQERNRIAVLCDSAWGRTVAEYISSTNDDVIVPNVTSSCHQQLSEARSEGVSSFISMCESAVPTKSSDHIVIFQPCSTKNVPCLVFEPSLRVKLSIWLQYMRLAGLKTIFVANRTLLGHMPHLTRGIRIVTEFNTDVGSANFSAITTPVDSIVAAVPNVETLVSALEESNRRGIHFRHFFVASVLESDAVTLERYAVRGMNIYTIGPAALGPEQFVLPTVDGRQGDREAALVVRAVALARKALASDAEMDGFSSDVLMYNVRNAEPISKVDLASGRWLTLAATQNGTLTPSDVLYVLPSRLLSKLPGEALCATQGAFTISGTGTASWQHYERTYDVTDTPSVLLMLGRRPFKVSVQCPHASADYSCDVTGHRPSCREKLTSNNDSRILSRTARSTAENVFVFDIATNRLSPYQSHPIAVDHQDYNVNVPNDYHRNYHYERHGYHHDDDDYQGESEGYDHDDYDYHDYYEQRHKEAMEQKEKLKKIGIAIIPRALTCAGAAFGCVLCVVLLTISPVVPALACTGPCAVGTLASCGGLVGQIIERFITLERENKQNYG